MNNNSNMIHNFEQAPPAGIKAVLLFWAPWHPESIPENTTSSSSASSNIVFGRVQAEHFPDLAQLYKVNSVPTFVLLDEHGAMVETFVGVADVASITQAVQRLVNTSSSSTTTANSKSASDNNATPSTPPPLTKHCNNVWIV
jgi:thioredoxin-like negative regulator of GroEL